MRDEESGKVTWRAFTATQATGSAELQQWIGAILYGMDWGHTPDHAAFRFVPFAVETCGYMGKEAVKFVNRLGDIAAESGRIPKGAFVRWAMQLLSVTVQRGNAEMYRISPPEWAGHLAGAGFALRC